MTISSTGSLFSNIFNGIVKDFQSAAPIVEGVWKKAVSVIPTLEKDAEAGVSALKQQVSNAFAWADTQSSPVFADATSMVESAADTLVMGLTLGLATPAIPLVNAGIEQGFALLHAVLDHAEASVKSQLSLPPPTSAAKPTVTGAVAAVTGAVTMAAAGSIAP